jgi:G:T-mismatch repair DNA endonuclease (very short patch repair protein)
MQRSRIITLESANMVGAEDRNKETEFALINKMIEGDQKGEQINRDAGLGRSNKERDKMQKGAPVENGLRIQEVWERKWDAPEASGEARTEAMHSKTRGAEGEVAAAAVRRTTNWS